MRKAQANAFQRAAQELGRENVAAEDWNRIFGGQTAAALDQKYATQQPATTAEPPKKKNRFGRFVDNLQSADFDDALGDILHGGGVALAAPKEYLVDPFMGVLSGATSRERKEILDENGNPTGRYYRDVHENSKTWGPIDVGSFARTARSIKDFVKDPAGQYQEGRQAWDESINSPEVNAFVRTAVETATDPMLYIGSGTVGGLSKGLAARGLIPTNPAVRAALTGRFSPVGGLLEGASAKGALGIALGAGAGAQAAESFDIPWLPEGLERAVLPMAGGALAGGWAGKAKLPSARPWKGAETATRAELGWDPQAMEAGAAISREEKAAVFSPKETPEGPVTGGWKSRIAALRPATRAAQERARAEGKDVALPFHPPPPSGLDNLLANGQQGLQQLYAGTSPGVMEAADTGLAIARNNGQLLLNGELTLNDMFPAMVHGILSKRLTPLVHESGAIDSLRNGLLWWFAKARNGEWDTTKVTRTVQTSSGAATRRTYSKDTWNFLSWAKSSAIEAGSPGRGALANVNDIGTDFLEKLVAPVTLGRDVRGPNGDVLFRAGETLSKMDAVERVLLYPSLDGRWKRDVLLGDIQGVGMQAKVLSLVLGMTGHSDVVVLDRWQLRNLWPSLDASLAARGLADDQRYEAMESALVGSWAKARPVYTAVEDILKQHGQTPFDFHYRTWVAVQDAVVGHGMMQDVLEFGRQGLMPRKGAGPGEVEFSERAFRDLKLEAEGKMSRRSSEMKRYSQGSQGPTEIASRLHSVYVKKGDLEAAIARLEGEGARYNVELLPDGEHAALRFLDDPEGYQAARSLRDLSHVFSETPGGATRRLTPADVPADAGFRATNDYEAFEAAKQQNTRGENLAPKAPEELAHSQVFMTPDRRAGFLVDDRGDFGNLFNNGSAVPGAGRDAIASAVENGALTLDAYHGFLPALYAQFGWVPTEAVRWSDEFAPPGWDYAANGRPDVIIMAYRGGDRATIRERVGSFPEYRHPGIYANDWDHAKARARASVLDRGVPGPGAGPVGPQDVGAERARVDVGAPRAPQGPGGVRPQPHDLAFEATPARALAPPDVTSQPRAPRAGNVAGGERPPYTGPKPGVENAERLRNGEQPARGKKALISRILMEARRGRSNSGLTGRGLDEDAARAAVEFIDALPEQYTELLASSFVSGRDISGGTASAGANVAGTYDPATALITIAKGITNASSDPERVIVHEMAHHLERFVTQEDHAALRQQWLREMGNPGFFPGSGQGGEALRRAQGALAKLAADPKATLTAEERASLEGLYRWQGGFAEWFAENIADRALRDQYPAPVKSAFERAREHVANLLIGAYNFLLRRGERDAAERVYQKLLRGDYEAFDTRLGADGGDELAMAVGPSRYEKQQNVKNARATARTVGADLFASAPAADVRAGQAAYLNSARGRIDNGIRKALAQAPGAVSMDRNLVKDTDVTPFVVQERTRLGNVIDSYEGLADYLMQRVEGAGLKAAFDPEDGNYWVEVGGQRLQFGDLVEGSTPEAEMARAALSPSQQSALAEVADFNASLNENLRYHGRSLPFDDSTDNAYFPRVVVGADGVGRPMLPGTGGGLATGGPWAKERTQAAMEAGVADRKLNYANPREAFRLMVRSKLKVAADSRIAEALRPLGQSAEDVNKAGGVAGVTHVELGPTVAPSLNGVYFDGPTAERILAGLKGKPAADVGALRAVNSALTPLRAMGDVSWFGQQGAAFLFRHPLRASRAAVTVIRSAMGDASGYRKLMDGALAEGAERTGLEVAEYRKLLIANGLHFVPDELGETGIGFSSGARRLPVAGKVATFSNETFARYLNLARVTFANDAVELAMKTNRLDELRGALASVNRMTGATGRKPSSVESLVEFAPRFFSAAVEQTFAAVTKGGLEGAIARRHMARMLGTGALITVAANAARGYDTDLDPTSDNFLRIRNVGGLDVSLFGTYSTFFKALARTSTGDTAAPLRLLEGKLSPAVGLIYWPVKGETYLGEPLSPRGDPVGTVYEYGKSMLPFGLQTMVDQGIEPAVRERDAAQLLEGLKSELASGTGLTSTPMSAVERRDFARGDRSESALMVRPEALGIGARQGAAQREYGMDYDQLSGADKSRVNERPDVKGYQAEADRNALTRDDDRSKMTQSSLDIGKKLDALSEEFASGQISGNEFREQYRRLQDELRGARNAVGGGSKGVLGGWFALYDQAQLPDGRVNYERLDALQAAYREQHPEIDDEVARITGVHDNEVMRQYRQAQALAREYYALPAYRGLSLEEGQTAGRVIDIAQAMVQAGMARTIRQAFAQLATQDKEAVRLARIAMNRGANPQRRAFRRANPLFAQFYGDVAQL